MPKLPKKISVVDSMAEFFFGLVIVLFAYLLYPRGPFDVTTSVSDLAMTTVPPPGCPVRSAPDAGFEPASADHNFLALLKALFCCCCTPEPETWVPPDWSTVIWEMAATNSCWPYIPFDISGWPRCTDAGTTFPK